MSERIRRFGPPLLVGLAAILVYANALANGFAFDDVYIVQNNTRVHDLADLHSIWLKPYWPSFGEELGLWRPLVIFAYAVQWALAGDNAVVFHAVSIGLHALASVLTFQLLRALSAPLAGALAGALIFAVHPVHTEVVANVVGQAELIAANATLAACLIHARRGDGPGLAWGRLAALLLLFLAGVLTKESAIVLPGLLVAIDFVQGRVRLDTTSMGRYARALFMPAVLLVATTIVYFSFRVGVLGSIGGVDAAPNLGFLREEHRVLVAFRGWIEYFRLLVFPMDLSADYSPGVILPVEGWTPMVALGAVILAATALLACLTPVAPAAGLPAAWLLITMVPTSNLFMPIGVVVAERLLYTPSVAVSLAVAAFAAALRAPEVTARTRRFALAGCAVVMVLFAGRTWLRNPDWESTDTVLASIVRDHPESYRSQWWSASLAYRRRQQELGNRYMDLAYRIWPHDPELLNEMGFIRIGRAQFDSAAAFIERSREITPWIMRTHVLLAEAYIGAGRFDDAAASLREAQRLGASPQLVLPLLAQAHEGQGDGTRAIAAWDATVRQSPEFWNYWARYARALAVNGYDERARLAADSAFARTPAADTVARRLVGQLRTEIEAGCYDADGTHASGCEDPLGQWKLLATLVTQIGENAKDSQNARDGGPDAAGPDMRSSQPTIDESTP